MPTTLPDLTPLPGKQTGAEVTKLVGLMQRLLAPDGCPWDREQTLETLVPYLVEETYEVVDALATGDVDDHREELGDLLLQIVFQSELRFAEGKFGIDDVARGIVAKLVRRHPHVFGDVVAKDADAVLANWAKLKAGEKAEKGKHGALDGVPQSAPALLRATRTGEKAGAVGLRLARRRRAARQGRRGAAASSTRPAAAATRARCSASSATAVRDGEPGAQAGARRRAGAARRHRSVRAPLRARRDGRWPPQGRAVADAPADEQDRLWEVGETRRSQSPDGVKVAACRCRSRPRSRSTGWSRDGIRTARPSRRRAGRRCTAPRSRSAPRCCGRLGHGTDQARAAPASRNLGLGLPAPPRVRSSDKDVDGILDRVFGQAPDGKTAPRAKGGPR